MHLGLKVHEITVVHGLQSLWYYYAVKQFYVIFVNVHSVSVPLHTCRGDFVLLLPKMHELFLPRKISQCSSHHNTHTCMGNNTIVHTCAWRKY